MFKLTVLLTFVALGACSTAKLGQLNEKNNKEITKDNNVKLGNVEILDTNMDFIMEYTVTIFVQDAYQQYSNSIARMEAINAGLGFVYETHLWSVLNDAIGYSVMQQYYALLKVDGADTIYIHGIKTC